MARIDNPENIRALFDVVERFVLSDGGDGDGWIVSTEYIKLASEFEAYQSSKASWFSSRMNSEKYITFYRGQETITFVGDIDDTPQWSGIVVII